MKRVLSVIGTRPEIIKMARVINRLDSMPIDHRVCFTGQHQDLGEPLLKLFGIDVDYPLDVMKEGQSLSDLSQLLMRGIDNVVKDCKPDYIIIQGDTASVAMTALVGTYNKIPIAHIEAGARSFQKMSPFPEEVYRVMADHMADLLFASTFNHSVNLLAENIDPKKVMITGNPGIDTLRWTMHNHSYYLSHLNMMKDIILITAHRRESFGAGIANICQAVKELARTFPDKKFIFPVHPNPNVRPVIHSYLGKIENVIPIAPLKYIDMIAAMMRSSLIMTDSGGLQIEAVYLAKPTLVMRDVTEWTDGIDAGCSRLVGTKVESIVEGACKVLDGTDPIFFTEEDRLIYGDGHASEKIVGRIMKELQ